MVNNNQRCGMIGSDRCLLEISDLYRRVDEQRFGGNRRGPAEQSGRPFGLSQKRLDHVGTSIPL